MSFWNKASSGLSTSNPEGQQGSDKGKSVLDTIMDEFNVTSADSGTPNQSQNELKLILLILKAKLIAKKIMIQNLTKENIDLFERIGTEREKHEVRIAYWSISCGKMEFH